VKTLFRAFLVLVALAIGALAWDVWQLRALRPPEDRSFEGFVRAGRQGSLLIDAPHRRLYWVTSMKTILPYSEPAVYEFDRSGALVNWSPGTSEGMILDAPVRRSGAPATLGEARAWLK
jgi:hypothetical protein